LGVIFHRALWDLQSAQYHTKKKWGAVGGVYRQTPPRLSRRTACLPTVQRTVGSKLLAAQGQADDLHRSLMGQARLATGDLPFHRLEDCGKHAACSIEAGG
jgi:hypothetical protein